MYTVDDLFQIDYPSISAAMSHELKKNIIFIHANPLHILLLRVICWLSTVAQKSQPKALPVLSQVYDKTLSLHVPTSSTHHTLSYPQQPPKNEFLIFLSFSHHFARQSFASKTIQSSRHHKPALAWNTDFCFFLASRAPRYV